MSSVIWRIRLLLLLPGGGVDISWWTDFGEGLRGHVCISWAYQRTWKAILAARVVCRFGNYRRVDFGFNHLDLIV